MTELELTKFDSLKEFYGERYIELLKRILIKKWISYEDICFILLISDLVKRDEEFIDSYSIARVLIGFADPASYVLTKFNIIGEIPKDYPEQPKYYISLSEGSVNDHLLNKNF